jgi:hypothetical protein
MADVARCRQVAGTDVTKPSYRSLALRIPYVYPRSIESSIAIGLGCMHRKCVQAHRRRRRKRMIYEQTR